MFGAKPNSSYQRKVRLKINISICWSSILKLPGGINSFFPDKRIIFQMNIFITYRSDWNLQFFACFLPHPSKFQPCAWKRPYKYPCVSSPICSTQQLPIQIFARVLSRGWTHRVCMDRSYLSSIMLPNIRLISSLNQVRFHASYLTFYTSATWMMMVTFELVNFWILNRPTVI